MNRIAIVFMIQLTLVSVVTELNAQALRIPYSTNHACISGRKIGVTDILITWNAPGVKGREGKIWGTEIAYYGTQVLGFGSNVPSPWRAGADECTTMSFSTDVTINGRNLAAGKYGFFIELYPDSSILIFHKNHHSWGSYFYDSTDEVLRVVTRQIKDQKNMVERLDFTFRNQTDRSVEISLEWEYWRIPFLLEVDHKANTLKYIKDQMSGELGFDPPSLQAAANWCLRNEINYEQALDWIISSTNPNLGGLQTFSALSTRSGLLEKLGKKEEAVLYMNQAMDKATAIELHQYGRQLLQQRKTTEAMSVFELNFKKNKGVWPTHVGMMRGLSATGNLKKALEHARLALLQAPDEINRKSLESAIKKLEAGEALGI
ncbi:MAG: DUF2911 domain-containing protein [Saprospiraceae bacterium]|nr:DUF2911 domain-containing protein [Saprospiraceae bacterium]